MNGLIELTPAGLYCSQGDFYIDPWLPVKRAVISHSHSDHSRPGSHYYLAHHLSIPVMKYRLGNDSIFEGISYGERRLINGVSVSFHPAGHIPGSSQIRVEFKGEVWVFSGDYKLHHDNFNEPFEPVKCNVFITESTFALPVYKWLPFNNSVGEINEWWSRNAESGKASVIFAYAVGKAQEIINNVDTSIGPIVTHGSVENINVLMRDAGIPVKATTHAMAVTDKKLFSNALVIAPVSALKSPWLKRFGAHSTAIASGWMVVRGARRRRAVDRGFALSDHADWKDLLTAVNETGAERIFVTHGFTEVFSRYLREQGREAYPVKTEYGDESADESLNPTTDEGIHGADNTA